MAYDFGLVGDFTSDIILMILLSAAILYLKINLLPGYTNRSNMTPKIITLNCLKITIADSILLSIEEDGKTLTAGQIGCYVPQYSEVSIDYQDAHMLRLNISNIAKLIIKHRVHKSSNVYSVQWLLNNNKKQRDLLQDSYDFLDHHWYGLGHFFNHHWPLEKCQGSGSMVTGESGPFFSDYFGGIQERVLLSSTGVGFVVANNQPLFLSINNKFDHKFHLKTAGKSPYQKRSLQERQLEYEIYKSSDITTLWKTIQECNYKTPIKIPNEAIFKHPIWSTWAEYKKDINQEKVINFAKKIRECALPYSVIGIDDDWTPHYGDLKFDANKFPNPKEMIAELKEMDFIVSLWVHPYLSVLADSFREGWRNKYVVQSSLGLPAIYSWWDGYAALIDFTNSKASSWFLKNLENLKTNYGVDTFKLDAGESYQLSVFDKTKNQLKYPNEFTNIFVEIAGKCDTKTKAQEMRVGSSNQDQPMFFRLQDKDSNWGYFNGIKTVIPHVLTQGLLGYPFVLPDMIGGNAYSIISGSTYPDRELYIRWMQLNALLPAMQFSIPPWRYDRDVLTIAQQMCQLHESYSPKIIELAHESTQTGAPICRPLWWIAPNDRIALTIDSEFLLGNDTLVAPVLDQGATSRDVYLTAGKWRDENSAVTLEGGRWYKDYPAKLNVLVYFEKID